jgi:protein AroM
MGHQALNGLLTDAVRRSEEDGAVATLLLCTGHFEDLPAQRPLLSAEPLVQQGVQALAGNEPVGVVCPLPEQAADVHDRWQQVLPGPITTAPASPYTNDDDALRSAASTLAAAGSTLLVLDCIGYTEHMRTLVARASGLPVLLARTLAVRLAVEQVSAGN